MSTWIAKLKEAKELFDGGLISEDQYNQLRDEAFSLRDGGNDNTEDDLSGETQMFTGTEPVDDELGSDTLAGTTHFVPEADVNELASDPLSSDTLAGSTQFVPDFDMDAGNDTLSGVTMMGNVVSLNGDNIENLPAGTVFDGRYSVVAPLGKGGMGMVYEVIDPKVKQRMALKVLRPEIAKNQRVIDSFAEEVAIGQRLNHPNLLQIRHLETRSDSPYVIMELMDGGDVDEHLAANGGKISSQSTLSIMKQACSALSALHNERIIHLDLKPQNLLMNSDGTVKLSDFGISSSLKDQRSGHSGSGTLFYAPPEQMDGGQCDVRTDIYALGMMTGQLLSGRFPFALKKAEEVQEWHRSGARDFAYLSGKVAQVLAKACAVSIDDRYRTVNEFIGELEKALDHKPWYPASLTLESVHSSLVLVNGTEHTMDVANLLPQGVLTPSLTLKGGKVLMQSNPFALAEIGVLDYLSSKLKPVVEDILSGSDSKLSALPKQDSTTESHLAMLAKRFGLSDRSVQRRLYYATDNLRNWRDHLTLSHTYQRAISDMKSAANLVEGISAVSISERLDVARHKRWVQGDVSTVQRSMFGIEENCQSAQDWQKLASANVALFRDWGVADAILQQIDQSELSDISAAIVFLESQISIFGLRDVLTEAGKILDGLAESSEDYTKIAFFWKQVGANDQFNRATEERQKLFRSTIQLLADDIEKLDIHIPKPTGHLHETDVVRYERQVREQKEWYSHLQDLRSKVLQTDVILSVPSGLLRKEEIEAYRDQVLIQVRLYRQVQKLDSIAQILNLEPMGWIRPYRIEQVEQRREEIATYSEYADQMKGMLEKANQLGWDVSQSSRVEAADVNAFAEQLAKQQILSEQLGKFRSMAETLGGTLTLPEYPLTPEKLAMVEAQMSSIRVEADVREQINRARSIGWNLKMPSKPYTTDMVDRLKADVFHQMQMLEKCHNRLRLLPPNPPISKVMYEEFQHRLSQQLQWHQELYELHQQEPTLLRPVPPYEESVVAEFQAKIERVQKRRKGLAYGGMSVLVLSVLASFIPTLFKDTTIPEQLPEPPVEIIDSDIEVRDSFTYEPDVRRDPFQSFLGTASEGSLIDSIPRAPLQNYDVEQYSLGGILFGIDKPRAMLEDPDGIGHVVEIGTYIGTKWGKVESIEEGVVVITEELQTVDGEIVVKRHELRLSSQ